MISRPMLTLALGLALAPPLGAQERPAGDDDVPDAEVGIRGGVTYERHDETGVTVVLLPGGRTARGPSLYGTFFMTDETAIEPQFGLSYVHARGGTSWVMAGALQIAQWMASPADDAPYGFMHGSFFAPDGNDPVWGLGGGAGYRWIVGGHWGIRLEGRYRRLFRSRPGGFNEFSLGVGVGAMIRD